MHGLGRTPANDASRAASSASLRRHDRCWRAAGVLGLAALVLQLIPGCSIPIPQAEKDPTRFYVLTAVTPAAARVPGGPALHLRQVEVASYLTSRTMIVRRGDHEIEFREFARWGEALDAGIGRVLREELLARGAAAAVLTPGMRAPGANYDYELSVRVLACEGAADGAVLFRAVWDLRSAGSAAAAIAAGDFRPAELRWDGKTEASLAAQLSAAIAGLAEEIAAALKR